MWLGATRPAKEGIRKCNYMNFTATYGLAGPFKVLLYEFYSSWVGNARKILGQN